MYFITSLISIVIRKMIDEIDLPEPLKPIGKYVTVLNLLEKYSS